MSLNPASPTPDSYTWRSDGAGVTIHLSLDVVDRLSVEVMRGFGAVPRRGAEVGGLLLGRVDSSAGNAAVMVDDFEPVASDHQFGPSFRLSDTDEARFVEAVERWKPRSGSPLYAVGYYRSHTRDGFALSADDLDVLDRHLPQPHHVALLIRPYATRVSVASFAVRQGGAWAQSDLTPEFPFRRKDLGGGTAKPRGRLHSVPAPLEESADEFDDAPSAVPVAEPTWTRRPPITPLQPAPNRRSLFAPLALLAILASGIVGYQVARGVTGPVPAVEWLTLRLTAEMRGGELRVHWDRSAPAVTAASGGLLSIQEGNAVSEVGLSRAQLLVGEAVYHPRGRDVRCTLQVTVRERTRLTESVHLVPAGQ